MAVLPLTRKMQLLLWKLSVSRRASARLILMPGVCLMSLSGEQRKRHTTSYRTYTNDLERMVKVSMRSLLSYRSNYSASDHDYPFQGSQRLATTPTPDWSSIAMFLVSHLQVVPYDAYQGSEERSYRTPPTGVRLDW